MSLSLSSPGTGTGTAEADALVGVLTDSEIDNQLVLDMGDQEENEVDFLADALEEMTGQELTGDTTAAYGGGLAPRSSGDTAATHGGGLAPRSLG